MIQLCFFSSFVVGSGSQFESGWTWELERGRASGGNINTRTLIDNGYEIVSCFLLSIPEDNSLLRARIMYMTSCPRNPILLGADHCFGWEDLLLAVSMEGSLWNAWNTGLLEYRSTGNTHVFRVWCVPPSFADHRAIGTPQCIRGRRHAPENKLPTGLMSFKYLPS